MEQSIFFQKKIYLQVINIMWVRVINFGPRRFINEVLVAGEIFLPWRACNHRTGINYTPNSISLLAQLYDCMYPVQCSLCGVIVLLKICAKQISFLN
jgi:hypothetical protein